MFDKERETHKWDRIFREPNVNTTFKHIDEYQEGLREIANSWKAQGIETILDLGCGVGRNALEFCKKGFKVVGMDISREALVTFNSHLDQENLTVNLVKGTNNTLPFSNESFDAILAVRSLQHGSLKNIRDSISEIARVLKPRGSIFVSVCGRYAMGRLRPNLVSTATRIGDNLYIPNEGWERGIIHYIFNKKVIYNLFKDFQMQNFWEDSEDYYCFLAYKK